MFEKDLETLRKTFNLPIKYDYANQGYYYEDADVSFDIPMSDDVIKTIYGALSQLALFENTTAFRNAKESLEKIMSRLEIDLKRQKSGADDVIFYEKHIDFSGDIWVASIYDSIVEHKKITFTFRMFDNTQNHTIDPYALKEIYGRWCVLGRENEEAVIYGLDRVANLQVHDDNFAYDSDFKESLQYDIIHSVGQLDFTKRAHEVILLYHNSVADTVLATNISETQKVLRRDERGLRVFFKVNINEEFIRMAILPYLDKVEVLYPDHMIGKVINIMNVFLSKYNLSIAKISKKQKRKEGGTPND